MEVNSYGKTYKVFPVIGKYRVNDGLAIQLYHIAEWGGTEPFATLTVCLDDELPKDFAYVDVNNCPWAVEFIEKYDLGCPYIENGALITKSSGYCEYPLYVFDTDKLNAEEVG